MMIVVPVSESSFIREINSGETSVGPYGAGSIPVNLEKLCFDALLHN